MEKQLRDGDLVDGAGSSVGTSGSTGGQAYAQNLDLNMQSISDEVAAVSAQNSNEFYQPESTLLDIADSAAVASPMETHPPDSAFVPYSPRSPERSK